jgi:hypothetical protein
LFAKLTATITPASAADLSTDVRDRVTGKSGVGVSTAVGVDEADMAVGFRVVCGLSVAVAPGNDVDPVEKIAIVVVSRLRDMAVAMPRTAIIPTATGNLQRLLEAIPASSPTSNSTR